MKFFYFNGEFLRVGSACIDPSDRGLLLGDGLFETMRIYSGKALFLNEYIMRLKEGLQILNIPFPDQLENIGTIIEKLIELNQLNCDASLRLTVTRGTGPRGLLPPEKIQPTILITAAVINESSKKNGLTAVISDFKKNEYSPLVRIKSINYLENILGRIEAQKKVADEVIFLNTKNFVTETSCANIFIVTNNVLHTPPITDGIIPGITRKIILKILVEKNIKFFEKSLTVEQLLQADEIFITNSLFPIQPLLAINNQAILKDQIKGPWTKMIEKHFNDHIQALF